MDTLIDLANRVFGTRRLFIAFVKVVVFFYLLRKRNTPIEVITESGLKDQYDYIIVGAGTAGSVVASRLSEDPAISVLLLEAGEDQSRNTQVAVPYLHPLQWQTPLDWNYTIVEQEHACHGFEGCRIPRGKMLGGTSSMNAMIYARGSKRDFDNWAELGATGWSYDEVLPYFLKSQDSEQTDLIASGYHATGGPMRTSAPSDVAPIASLFLVAAAVLGYPIKDYNTPDGLGFSVSQTTVRDGLRESTDVSFLTNASSRTNLDILTGAHVTKVLIQDSTAEGVEMVTKDGVVRTVSAGQEVVLSAGVIGSPQILLLSGVGPADHLVSLQIPVVADLPVGDNLHDRTHLSVPFMMDQNLGLKEDNVSSLSAVTNFFLWGAGALGQTPFPAAGFYSLSEEDDAEPEAMIMFSPVDFMTYPTELYVDHLTTIGASEEYAEWAKAQRQRVWDNEACPGCTWLGDISILQPRSRGTVRLESSDPLTQPLIDPQYLASNRDRNKMRRALKSMLKIAETEPMASTGSRPVVDAALPGCRDLGFMNNDFLNCWIKQSIYIGAHAVGTCKMGADDDDTAVVDAQLRVRGVAGLRVADASVMPQLVSANPAAAVVMIGERIADMIRGVDSVQGIRQELENKGIIDL